MQKNAKNPNSSGEKPAAIGLHVTYARIINEAKQIEQKGKNGGPLPSAIASGVAAGILLTLIAMRKKREEPLPKVPVGTEKQVEIAKVQGDLPPHVRENIIKNPRIDPRTLVEMKGNFE